MGRGKVAVERILDDETTAVDGSSVLLWGAHKSLELSGVTSSGTGAAVVKVQGSNTQDIWHDLYEFPQLTLGTVRTGATHEIESTWKYTRAAVVSITGTGASVRLTVGNLPGF